MSGVISSENTGVLRQYGFLSQGNRSVQKTVLMEDCFNTTGVNILQKEEDFVLGRIPGF